MAHAHHKTFNDSPKLDPALVDKGFKVGLVLGAVGVGASLVGLFIGGDEGRTQFYFSWLMAFFFFTTIGLGALFFTIIHHLTRAAWSTTLRRVAENLAMNLPLMAVLFIPVLVGLHDLYHWSHAEAVANDPILKWKEGYLNTTFFVIRAVIYFAVWSFFAWKLRSLSVKQDETGDVNLTFQMRKFAPVGMLLFALSVTFAGFDWLMSLDPHWFSTIFGVVIFAGSVIAWFATAGLIGLWFTKRGVLSHTISVGNLHDVGKLLFGFIVFWAYVSFSQYYLIWYANIPEETAWYIHRMGHGWEKIGALVIIGHFILPFWFLMSRHVKRSRTALGLACGWMLFMHYVDLFYMVAPTNPWNAHGPYVHWLDITTLLGIGGLFFAFFIRRFRSESVVALKDPQLIASMEYDNA